MVGSKFIRFSLGAASVVCVQKRNLFFYALQDFHLVIYS